MLDIPATTAAVPPLSLADQATNPEQFAADLGGSFRRFGFAIVKDHGIPQALIDRAWAETAKLFALPDEEKRQYFVAGGGGGGVEHGGGIRPVYVIVTPGPRRVPAKAGTQAGRSGLGSCFAGAQVAEPAPRSRRSHINVDQQGGA